MVTCDNFKQPRRPCLFAANDKQLRKTYGSKYQLTLLPNQFSKRTNFSELSALPDYDYYLIRCSFDILDKRVFRFAGIKLVGFFLFSHYFNYGNV